MARSAVKEVPKNPYPPTVGMKDSALNELGHRYPGKSARGISIPGFLRAYPDNRYCHAFLFWLRGGHLITCRLCGRHTQWKQIKQRPSAFRSRCCATTLSATRGTLFYRSSKSLWLWFYVIVLVLSLGASPSLAFLAGHLNVDRHTAWCMMLKIRMQFTQICSQGSRNLRGKTVCVENLKFRNVLSKNGQKGGYTHIVVVSTPRNAFAFALPRRHPYHYRKLLDELGVARNVHTYDYDFHRIGSKLAGYDVQLLERDKEDNPSEVWASFQYGRALSVYLTRSLRKWPVKVGRKYVQHYISEFVFRFNFAGDKAMMFPLFLSSLGKVEYCDEEEARSKTNSFNKRSADGIPG